MNIVILTSSRADYGIYQPLISKLANDSFFNIKIVVFGSHISKFHGYTINQIISDGFQVYKVIESILITDTEESISTSIGLTIQKFSSFWKDEKNSVDLIFCLGDRYEMFAAVTASIPFNIPIAHIHGGESTLGAIDNVFRHSLTLMSKYHFPATELYSKKIQQLLNKKKNILNVGSLSIENFNSIELYSAQEFEKKYQISFDLPTILCTYHPETVNTQINEYNIVELLETFASLEKIKVIITLPNLDTTGSMIREKIATYANKYPHIKTIESFGAKGYFSCMNFSNILVGNTSSGIIEAASLKKYVINIGDRQKGRARGSNVYDCEVKQPKLIELISKLINLPPYEKGNMYFKENTSERIISFIKKEYLKLKPIS